MNYFGARVHSRLPLLWGLDEHSRSQWTCQGLEKSYGTFGGGTCLVNTGDLISLGIPCVELCPNYCGNVRSVLNFETK